MAGDKPTALVGTRAVERFLRRWYALAGGSVALDVGGTIQPSVEMRPMFPWEFRDWGIIPFATFANVGAVAAEHSYMEVQQVPTHDVVIVRMMMGQTGTIRTMAATIGDATNVAAGPRDSGFPVPFGQPITNLFIVAATCAPGALGGISFANQPANAVYEEPVIIRAGSPNVLVLNNDTVNQAVGISVSGFLVPINMTLT